MSKLVSIIMPAYNAEKYIGEAIESVLGQRYANWELIIVNDGSQDRTEEIILQFSDERISYYIKENEGVASARNLGLANMRGDYFTFLDSDDLWPTESLEERVKLLDANDDVDFVDGTVVKVTDQLEPIGSWSPAMLGNPLYDLIYLRGKSFLGLTWLIRRQADIDYCFKDGITHCEDLIFFTDLARNGRGKYTYAAHETYIYRMRRGSAMHDIKGLERGYISFIGYLKNEFKATWFTLFKVKTRVIRIVSLSHLIDGRSPFDSFICIPRILFS